MNCFPNDKGRGLNLSFPWGHRRDHEKAKFMKSLILTFFFITKLHATECFSHGNKYSLNLIKNEKGEVDRIELKKLSVRNVEDKLLLQESVIKERIDADKKTFFEISPGDPGLRQDPNRPQLHIYPTRESFLLKLFDTSKTSSLRNEKDLKNLNCVPKGLGDVGDFLRKLTPSGNTDSTITREIPIMRTSKQ